MVPQVGRHKDVNPGVIGKMMVFCVCVVLFFNKTILAVWQVIRGMFLGCKTSMWNTTCGKDLIIFLHKLLRAELPIGPPN